MLLKINTSNHYYSTLFKYGTECCYITITGSVYTYRYGTVYTTITSTVLVDNSFKLLIGNPDATPEASQNRKLVVITVLHPRLVNFQNSVRGVDHFVPGTKCKILSMEKIWYKSSTKMASLELDNSQIPLFCTKKSQ